ncbi:MAG TPA: TlpA disulfide reductase family protein [Planctomycetota bacterium]|nr:TlpA disulfide reductase family protein [Planctomycetota bacterium]
MAPSRLGRFRIATAGGRSVGHGDFLGRPALLYGWASWHPSREALGDLEAFHRKHAGKVEVASIAFDTEGPGRPMRYYTAAAGTHTPLIDATFSLSRVWGIHSLPFWFLTDEDGCVQARGEDFSIKAAEAALRKRAKHVKETPRRRNRTLERVELLMQTAGTFLSRGRTDEAVGCLREAESLDPGNALLRDQRLALANPKRFYSGPIDLTWLAGQK